MALKKIQNNGEVNKRIDIGELSGKEQKKIKGGLLPYIEQDNLHKSKSKNIKDGTPNTIVHEEL